MMTLRSIDFITSEPHKIEEQILYRICSHFGGTLQLCFIFKLIEYLIRSAAGGFKVGRTFFLLIPSIKLYIKFLLRSDRTLATSGGGSDKTLSLKRRTVVFHPSSDRLLLELSAAKMRTWSRCRVRFQPRFGRGESQ